MKPSTAFLALAIAASRAPAARAVARAAQEEDASVAGTQYSEGRCQKWLAGALAADADGSDGLSEGEFHQFLSGIEEPAAVREYFAGKGSYGALHWTLQAAHKALACRCQDLGLGAGCCQVNFVSFCLYCRATHTVG